MLSGVSDPEEKRKLIGKEFIRVFEEEALKIGSVDLAAVVEAALDAIQLAVVAKPLTLAKQVDPLPAPVSGDADRLRLYREKLRSWVMAFGFSDADRFTATVETAYQDMLVRKFGRSARNGTHG